MRDYVKNVARAERLSKTRLNGYDDAWAVGTIKVRDKLRDGGGGGLDVLRGKDGMFDRENGWRVCWKVDVREAAVC